MTTAVNIVKIIGAWGLLIAGVTLLVLTPQPTMLPGVLFLGSIAFSQAPTSA